MEIPYEDIFPGLHALELYITANDGQVAYIIIPYYFPSGMKEVMMLLKIITNQPQYHNLTLVVAPKFGLQCGGAGDAFGVTFDCTLDEEVTSLQCFVDGQPITDCKLTPALYTCTW